MTDQTSLYLVRVSCILSKRRQDIIRFASISLDLFQNADTLVFNLIMSIYSFYLCIMSVLPQLGTHQKGTMIVVAVLSISLLIADRHSACNEEASLPLTMKSVLWPNPSLNMIGKSSIFFLIQV